MTIIEPFKNKFRINEFLYIGFLLLIFAILSIYLYNLNVNLKHAVSLREKTVQNLEAANAELRNQFYQITDIRNLNAFAQSHNLIPDKNPDYLEYKGLSLNFQAR